MKYILAVAFTLTVNLSISQKSQIRISDLQVSQVINDREGFEKRELSFTIEDITKVDSIFFFFTSKNFGDYGIVKGKISKSDDGSYILLIGGKVESKVTGRFNKVAPNFYFEPQKLNEIIYMSAYIKDLSGLNSDTTHNKLWRPMNIMDSSPDELIHILYPNPLKAGDKLNLLFGGSTTFSAKLISQDSQIISIADNIFSEGASLVAIPQNIEPGTYFIEVRTSNEVKKSKLVIY